jgi:hypothetical protein
MATKRMPLDRDRLVHFVRVAMYAFREHAKNLDKTQPSDFFTADALARLTREFRTYANDAEAMLNTLEESYRVDAEVEVL